MFNLALHVFRVLCFYPLLIHTGNAYAQNSLDWVLESDSDDILIHSRPHKEGLVEIEGTVPLSLPVMVLLCCYLKTPTMYQTG